MLFSPPFAAKIIAVCPSCPTMLTSAPFRISNSTAVVTPEKDLNLVQRTKIERIYYL